MHNIPTARIFHLEKLLNNEFESIEFLMIDFAKLHVQNVLEIAAEKAKIKQIPAGYYNAHIVDQDSILNVEYDYLENIK